MMIIALLSAMAGGLIGFSICALLVVADRADDEMERTVSEFEKDHGWD